MGRYSPETSYSHRIQKQGKGDYQISWAYDRYYQGSRQRHPQRRVMWTDRKGAERFAKKWGLKL